jgi:mannosyltransferase
LLVVVDVVAGLALRFWTTSKLWLDEAQSVNIAAHPLSQLTHYLRNDGAPPLYYVLLHVWMGLVGHSDADVRALSGVISVVMLVVGYAAARRWWGPQVALVAAGILAVLPYVVYFATETRMYALVMLFSAAQLWVLRAHQDRPRWSTAVAIALLGALMLYTQYWAIYLLAVLGIYAVAHWVRQRRAGDRPDSLLVGAIGMSVVLWLPWFPIFNEQRLHTGTPWSPAPGMSEIFTWVDDFTVNQSVPHVISSLHTEITLIVFLVVCFIGVIGATMTDRGLTMTVNLLGDPAARAMAWFVLATMVLGVTASHVDGAAYVPRYAAVVVVPLVFLAARGITVLHSPVRMLIVLTLLSGACLWTDRWGVGVQRTQAGEITAALADVPSGSVVFVCPDQLGPSLLRYSNPHLDYLGYPRFVAPEIVDWYDYLAAYHRYTAAQNAAREAATIGPSQSVFIVRAPNYGLHLTCWYFEQHLEHDLHRVAVPVVKLKPNSYYQAMEMQQLVATSVGDNGTAH